ncbi:hypothetical protein ACH5RR_033514 [Cinchona calisaya]|uniref:Small-subunit processome Utp12 domain-containing protein n=1 Tax=Cinchona calisaya TaxID=153742 RepID=A0ABD2YPD7_9GENT
MGSSNIRDILTSFSPSLDLFAISSGDGRIKIWDTVKSQVQTEFTDIVSTETRNEFFGKPESGGHLSVDYKCMVWLSLNKKKKRKLGTSLLVLGTGSGDVLALDVAAGQLKWRVNDCHPGGVGAISFSTHGSCIYTGGADGMVCELDSISGNLSRKFRASTKSISSISVSSDGKILATAAAQLKIFNSSDHKKLQKFSGHPGAVRCMGFSDDGNYVLSSSAGERYVAIWRIDGSKKQSACCFLAMDHPAVFLDCRSIATGDIDDAGLWILAISELGVCFFWQGNNIQELQNSKPTKICISSDDKTSKKHKGALPNIFAAKLQNVTKPGLGHVFLAYGLLVKPSFEKISVQSGTDVKLSSSLDGILLPISQLNKSKKATDVQNRITALDRAGAEDALLPMPKIFNLADANNGVRPVVSKDDLDKVEIDEATFSMEERLRSLGIVNVRDGFASTSISDSSILKDINLAVSTPQKKMKANIVSLEPSEAYNLLKVLVAAWHSRSCSGRYVLPWIYCLLLNHNEYVASQEPKTQLLDSLCKLCKSKETAIPLLLQLSGRLQLVTAQIDKATKSKGPSITYDEEMDESEDEDVDEVLYGVDEDSQIDSDSDD